MSLRGLVVPATFLLAALAPPLSAGVTVVDASSPTPVLQAAIDAAVNGDILLVLSGASEVQEEITIDGKGLTLAAWPAGSRVELYRLRIENLAAGQRVVVRGFTLTPDFAYGFGGTVPLPLPAALELDDCAGTVWIEDCDATSPDGFGSWVPGNHGASAQDCANVVLVRCDLIGGRGASQAPGCGAPFGSPGQPGGSGLHARNSTVVLHDCLLQGDAGGSAYTSGGCPVSGAAGHGVLFEWNSRGLVAGCTAIGGDHIGSSGAAGNGVRVADAGSSLALRLGTVLPGSGGSATPVSAPPGTLTQYLALPRQVEVTSPMAEGQSGSLTMTGVAGDFTALFIAFAGGYLPAPFKSGAFSLGSPFFGPFLLGTNPSGLWSIPFVAGPLSPASLQGQTYLMQLVVHDGVQVNFEGTTSFTLVDGTFP